MEPKDLVSLAAIIAVASILIGTFFLVNDNLKDIHATSDYKLATAFTEVAIDNLTAVVLAPRVLGAYEFACFNNESGVLIPSVFSGASANFTITNSRSPESTASIVATDSNNYSANCTYNSTDFSSNVWQDLNNTEVSVGEFGDWADLLVVGGMAAFILALIIGLIAIRSSKRVE